MSDRERFRRGLLDLIIQPGVVEVVLALHERDGSATLAELQAARLPHLVPLLRSLAAAGQVGRPDAGTWDSAPSPETRFTLTAAGTGLATTLGQIEDWGRRNLPVAAAHRRHPRGRTLGSN
jgi:hypothetical protein